MTGRGGSKVNLLTAVSGQRESRHENRPRVSTGMPSQADIDRCWDDVRRSQILHAEYDRRVLVQTMRHQGGYSNWMLEIEIALQTNQFLLSDNQNA